MLVELGDVLMIVSQISGTLIGTFIVGVFFYLDAVKNRSAASGTTPRDRYMRAAVRWVFAAYALPLLQPLMLVSVGSIWGAVSFVALSGLLLVATLSTVRGMATPGGAGSSIPLILNEWITTVAVVIAVLLPWLIGGGLPPASAYIPSLIIMIAAGFASTAALITSEFDLAIVMGRPTPDHPMSPSKTAEPPSLPKK